MAEKTYVIVPTSEITEQMVSDCVETSMDTVRKNDVDTKRILKYEGDKPASISAYSDYTRVQMQTELEKAEWQSGS